MFCLETLVKLTRIREKLQLKHILVIPTGKLKLCNIAFAQLW